MSARKDSISNIVTKILLYPLSFVVSVVTARILGPEDKGLLGFGMTLVSISVTVFAFGMGMGMFYNISTKKYAVPEVFWTTIFLAGILGFCISGFLAFIYLLEIIPLLNQFSILQIFLLCLIVIFGLFQSFISRLLLADNQFLKDNMIKVILGVVQPLFIIILVCFFKLGVKGVLISSAIMAFLGTLMLCFVMSMLHNSFLNSIRKDFLRDSWLYGIKSWLGDVTQMANLRIDQLILGFFVSAYELGIYVVAVGLAEILWFVPDAVNSVLLNKMTSPSLTINDKIVIAGRVCKALVVFTCFLALFLYFGVKYFLLPFGYGVEFYTVILPFVLLLPGSVCLIYAKVVTKILTGTGYVEDTTKAIIISSIANITLYLVLIPYWGVMGASIATTIGYFCISLATLFMLENRFGSYFRAFLFWSREDFIWGIYQLNATIKSLKMYRFS